MATKLFPHFVGYGQPDWETGLGGTGADVDLGSVARFWEPKILDTVQGSAGQSLGSFNTVAGPTGGVPTQSPLGGVADRWVTAPLAAGITISGTVTMNIRASESSMSANVGMQVLIQRIDNMGAIQQTVLNSEQGVEVGTSEGAQNWTAAPTSTAFNKGDRLLLTIYANDGGTMASGFTFSVYISGAAGATGDTFISLTENLTFLTTNPTGSQLFLTDVASDVATAAVDREAWTSRGAGVQNDVTNQVAGPTAPIQITDTAGGTVVDWWSRQLQAVTLGGLI
jgi:hypothetical protein